MCRNIRVLYHFDPPTTADEIRAAALQYVRKVSGIAKPSSRDQQVFDLAVDAVTHCTAHLLAGLSADVAVRTREGEAAKGRARWTARAARIATEK